MKQIWKHLSLLVLLAALLTFSVPIASAHSGRTDSSGGHHDNQNKSGLGSYHYHCGGYPAHLHPDGYCPYSSTYSGSESSSGSSSTQEPETPAAPTPTVTIQTHTDQLYLNETFTASASAEHTDSSDITWSSSDERVATVNAHGTITAVSLGTARITATADGTVSDSFTISVQEKVVEEIKLEEEDMKLTTGDKTVLHAEILPSDASFPTVTWTSSDPSIATVKSDGTVKTVGVGTVTITAESSNGLTDSVEIQVQEVVAERISILGDDTLKIGSQTQLDVCYEPENTTAKDITWSSSAEEILTVDENGLVCAHQVGSATITATQKDTKDTLKITVLPIAVKTVTISVDAPDTIYPGDTLSFSATVKPKNATYPEVTWTSSDEAIAVMDKSGALQVKSAGTVQITATADGVCETYALTVSPIAVKTVKISVDMPDAVYPGDTLSFSATVKPKNATYPEVTWTSSDETIATITKSGKFTANATGTVQITASADGVSETYEVEILSSIPDYVVWIILAVMAVIAIGIIVLICRLLRALIRKLRKFKSPK